MYFSCVAVSISQVQREDFKQNSTIQSQTGLLGTKSPQVAVIPPLVDLTKVAVEPGEGKSPQDKDEKGELLYRFTYTIHVHVYTSPFHPLLSCTQNCLLVINSLSLS